MFTQNEDEITINRAKSHVTEETKCLFNIDATRMTAIPVTEYDMDNEYIMDDDIGGQEVDFSKCKIHNLFLFFLCHSFLPSNKIKKSDFYIYSHN
jgi:hypothetical protein